MSDASAPQTSTTTENARAIDRKPRILLLMASIGGALSNFGILFLAARVLDVKENTEFLVFWSLMFGLFGVQSGIQNEATRATSDARAGGSNVFCSALILSTAFSALIAVTSPFWADYLLPSSPRLGTTVLVIIACLYPLYVTMTGALAGARHWMTYGSTLLTEVGLRVILVGIAAGFGYGLAGLEIGSAAAVFTLLVMLLVSRSARRTLVARSDVPLGRSVRNAVLAVSSTSCTALLITGYSALVQLTNPPSSMNMDPSSAITLTGACMLAVSLTRAPIMIPLTAFVAVAISAFTGHSGSAWDAVRKPFAVLAVVGLLGAAAAWPIGPWALRLFRPEYDLPGWYFAALTASSVLLAWLTILGALALATGHHFLYFAGWGVASGVAVVCLVLPIHLLASTAISVSLGPALGCAVFAIALQSTTPQRNHSHLTAAP